MPDAKREIDRLRSETPGLGIGMNLKTTAESRLFPRRQVASLLGADGRFLRPESIMRRVDQVLPEEVRRNGGPRWKPFSPAGSDPTISTAIITWPTGTLPCSGSSWGWHDSTAARPALPWWRTSTLPTSCAEHPRTVRTGSGRTRPGCLANRMLGTPIDCMPLSTGNVRRCQPSSPSWRPCHQAAVRSCAIPVGSMTFCGDEAAILSSASRSLPYPPLHRSGKP